MTTQRIVIAGEIYSPNLGDGIIHECLRYLFLRHMPEAEILPLDISGRSGWQPRDHSGRRTPALPRIFRRETSPFFHWLNLARFQANYSHHLQPSWSRLLEDNPILVIGGGKLLMDNQFDFPFKLHKLYQLAASPGIPIHLAACGVGSDWSSLSRQWLNPLLQQAATLSVRDLPSRADLVKAFPGCRPVVTCDPAIWAKQVYSPPVTAAKNNRIGLGVINSRDANSSQSPADKMSEVEYLDLWLRIIRQLSANGFEVEIFTNGNHYDTLAAARLLRLCQFHSIPCQMAAPPLHPADLVAQISSYQGMIVSRLHASLVAAAFQTPCIGLSWDNKVAAFYQQLGFAERAVPIHRCQPDQVIDQFHTALDESIPPETIQELKAQAVHTIEIILPSQSSG